MTWIERYLAAALRSIPEARRPDVERELRSSIEDGIDERLAAGDDRSRAERAVLEGLGDPMKLAAAYTGRPSFLIGPELFPLWRSTVVRIVGISLPFAVIILATLTLMDGGNYADVILAAFSAAINVPIQILFWGTVAFVFIERADPADPVRVGVLSKVGSAWKLEDLPVPAPKRLSARDATGDIVGILVTFGILLVLDSLKVPGPNGSNGILHGAFTGFVFPVVLASLLARAGLQVLSVAAGRWTTYMATINALLHLVLAVPVVVLALSGQFLNPYFADGIGWPELADPKGWPTLGIAIGTAIGTAWEILRGYARAWGSGDVRSLLNVSRSSS